MQAAKGSLAQSSDLDFGWIVVNRRSQSASPFVNYGLKKGAEDDDSLTPIHSSSE